MKNQTLALAAALVALVACSEDGPDVSSLSEPVSANAPDGWPLEVGDQITWKRLGELQSEFPGRLGVAEHAVGDIVYTAKWDIHRGALPGEDPKYLTEPDDSHVAYAGHYPWDQWAFGVRGSPYSTWYSSKNGLKLIHPPDRVSAWYATWDRLPKEAHGRGLVR